MKNFINHKVAMKTNQIRSISLALFLSISISLNCLNGQSIVFRIDTVVAQPGQEITVGVYASGLTDVGAMSLYISYENSVLTWLGAESWHPLLDNGYNLANSNGNVVGIVWFDVNPITSGPIKLLDLRFLYNTNSTDLTFLAASEVVNSSGLVVSPPPVFQNGKVVKHIQVVAIAINPEICLGESVVLNAIITGGLGGSTIQWTSTPAGFSATTQTTTATPSITTRYHVMVTEGFYSDTSSVVVTISQAQALGGFGGLLPVDSAVNLPLNILYSWFPVANATHYDLFVWQDGQTVPTSPVKSNLTDISYTYTNHNYETQYHWKVVAKNLCFSSTSPIQTLTTFALPELHVTQVSHSFSKSSQTIQVSWTVRNDGNGPTTTPVWYDRVWIAPDIEVRIGEPEDILIGTFPNPTYLAPGQSYTQIKTINLPPNLIGTYFIFVVTDALDALFINPGPSGFQIPYSPPPYLMAYSHGGSGVNLVKEVSDSGPYHDNFFYTPVTFPVPPLPDLRVTNVAAPISSFSGQTINVNWRVENFGSASTPQTSWHDKIYLSVDTILDGGDVLLRTIQHINRLDPDSSYQASTTVVLPNYISGPYHILVHTDAMNVVYEHAYDENNVKSSDTLTIILTPPPDLVVTSIIILGDTLSNGQDIVVKWTVQNQGATPPIVTSWYDNVFLSPSPTFVLGNAINLGSNKITQTAFQPGQTYTTQRTVRIPNAINGPYYLFVHTDFQNHIFESLGDTNNLALRSPAVQIISPDLSPGPIAPIIPDSTGKRFQVQWVLHNLGPGSLQNQSWTDRIYISQTPVFQPNISFPIADIRRNNAIPAYGSINVSDSTQVLHNYSEGTYYLHVGSDVFYEVFENGQENNNLNSQATALQVVRPDLSVTRILFPVAGSSGQTVEIQYTVKNIGNGKVTATQRRDQIWLSKTATYYPDSIISLGFLNQSMPLNPNDSVNVSFNAIIPNGVAGYFYVMVYTNLNDAIPEGNRYSNNRYISPNRMLIDLTPWPDLVVDSFIVADTVTAGLMQTISFIVKNNGLAIAQGAAWQDRLYFSSSNFWNPASITAFGTRIRSLAVDPDSSYQVNYSVTIPANLTPGYYYLYAVTDETNVIFEHTDEDNNRTRSAPIYVNPYPIDLAVTSASWVADTLSSGQSVTINYTVENISQVQTNKSSWTDAVYLSPDDKFSPGTDILVQSWQVNGPLAPGLNYQRTRQINIPYGISGDQYLIIRNDPSSTLKDIDYSNNSRAFANPSGTVIPFYVNELPTPDLIVTSFTVPPQAIAGQAFKVYWTIKNQGMADVNTLSLTDAIFLSNDFNISIGDLRVGNRMRPVSLAAGASLDDSLEITINIQNTANYILIIRTDNNDIVYEHNAEGNNTASGYLAISVAPPCDLIVTSVICPDTITVGAQVNFTWEIGNQGFNPASGTVTDALYISLDPILDNNDLLFAQFAGPLSLVPGTAVIRNLNAVIPGVADGLYYIIAATDVKNTVNETDDANNTSSTATPVMIQMKRLYVNQIQLDTIANGEFIYYRVDLHDSLLGETVLINLEGDSLWGNNEMFIARNRAPSKLDYDRRSPYSFKGNQEVVIPEVVAGAYYLMITGVNSQGPRQAVSLHAKKVNFEVRKIDPSHGGNTGNVTVRIDGSKFEPDMVIFLEKSNATQNDLQYAYAFNTYYVDPSLVFASFALEQGQYIGDNMQLGMSPGMYHLHIQKPFKDTIVVENAFEIFEGGQSNLLYNIVHPPNVRPNRYLTMSIQYANAGDFDIPVPGYAVMSMHGAPLGFNTDDLQNGITDVYVEFTDPNGPPGILRPGAAWTITLFTISSHRLVFRLIPYQE